VRQWLTQEQTANEVDAGWNDSARAIARAVAVDVVNEFDELLDADLKKGMMHSMNASTAQSIF
jgi:hypothetical protein